MNLEKEVLKHLGKLGFTGFVRDEFPEIIAWSPLRKSETEVIKIPTRFIASSKQEIIVPFLVVGITCKKPNKKQKELAKILLGKVFSNISVARKNKGKLVFDAFVLEEEVKNERAGYIG